MRHLALDIAKIPVVDEFSTGLKKFCHYAKAMGIEWEDGDGPLYLLGDQAQACQEAWDSNPTYWASLVPSTVKKKKKKEQIQSVILSHFPMSPPSPPPWLHPSIPTLPSSTHGEGNFSLWPLPIIRWSWLCGAWCNSRTILVVQLPTTSVLVPEINQ